MSAGAYTSSSPTLTVTKLLTRQRCDEARCVHLEFSRLTLQRLCELSRYFEDQGHEWLPAQSAVRLILLRNISSIFETGEDPPLPPAELLFQLVGAIQPALEQFLHHLGHLVFSLTPRFWRPQPSARRQEPATGSSLGSARPLLIFGSGFSFFRNIAGIERAARGRTPTARRPPQA